MPCYVYVNDLTPLTAAAKTIAGQKVCYGDIVIVNPVIMKVGGIAAGSFSKIVLASPSEFPYSTCSHGGVAQLGERLTGSQEVRGSIPLVSTRALNEAPTQVGAFFHIGTQGQRRRHDPPGRQDRALNDRRVHGSILPRGVKLMQMDSRHYYHSH